jgi:hypothetical protein
LFSEFLAKRPYPNKKGGLMPPYKCLKLRLQLNYFFSGVVDAGAAFFECEQQLELFLASLQAALVFVSQPALLSFTFSFFSTGFAALSCV